MCVHEGHACSAREAAGGKRGGRGAAPARRYGGRRLPVGRPDPRAVRLARRQRAAAAADAAPLRAQLGGVLRAHGGGCAYLHVCGHCADPRMALKGRLDLDLPRARLRRRAHRHRLLVWHHFWRQRHNQTLTIDVFPGPSCGQGADQGESHHGWAPQHQGRARRARLLRALLCVAAGICRVSPLRRLSAMRGGL